MRLVSARDSVYGGAPSSPQLVTRAPGTTEHLFRRTDVIPVMTVLAKDTVGYSLPEALRAAWRVDGERSVG